MKLGRFTLSAASVALLVIQLAMVSAIAGKYLYQRWRCPRVWTRAQAVDPELPMRGRYLALRLTVDGCQSTLPSAAEAAFPRDFSGAVKPGPYMLKQNTTRFRARLKVVNGALTAVAIGDQERPSGEEVEGSAGQPCNQMRLAEVTDYFVSDRARSPLPLQAGQELWIEVTVPPKGPPRPLQMAVKTGGVWRPVGPR